jgi:hypothetical protein
MLSDDARTRIAIALGVVGALMFGAVASSIVIAASLPLHVSIPLGIGGICLVGMASAIAPSRTSARSAPMIDPDKTIAVHSNDEDPSQLPK